VVARALDTFGVPGAAIAVSRDGLIRSQGFGVASLDSGLPVTPRTVFRVASITKPLTATLVLTLVEEGLIDLDLPVHHYLPGLALSNSTEEWQSAITVRHLLSHTSGLDCELSTNLARYGSVDDALARAVGLFSGLRQWAAPGVTMSYGNTGYWLAGRIVEVVTGVAFERAMWDRVFRPLKMGRTGFTAEQAIVNPVALGHQPVSEGSVEHKVLRTFAYPRARRASGGVISTVGNLLSFANWHLGHTADGPAVSRELRESMQLPLTSLRTSDKESWGVGWNIRYATDGTKLVGHGGSFGGYQTLLTLIPDRNLAYAVLTNSAQGSKSIKYIERAILKSELELELKVSDGVAIARSELEQFAGTWRQPLATYHVVPVDGGLDIVIDTTDHRGAVQQQTGPLRFEPLSGSDFIVREGLHKGTRADFVPNPESGRFEFLRFGLRVARRDQA
jgi:CubicO group peptidase (beta-lactamase class C family)